MDERNKSINELERAKQEARTSLDSLLENFGENLYKRSKDMQLDYEDIIQYNVFLQDIAETNTAIGKVEEKNRRFRELEDSIETKEHEEKERSKELAGIHRRLGKALLGNPSYSEFTSLFREQADALTAKLESLEERIKELENKEGGNVFSWIGKSAQGLVLRSFLSKAEESREGLFLTIGERFTSGSASAYDDEVSSLLDEIERIRAISHSAADELAVLRDEKRMIAASFGIDGNPQKQIQNLKNHISHVRDELRTLYRNFGAQASGIMDAEIEPERKYFIDTIVSAEDGEVIGRAVKLNQSIEEYEKNITKLKATLAIDSENVKIEKLKKTIAEKKGRIEELEKAISDLEGNISESEAVIEELKKQL